MTSSVNKKIVILGAGGFGREVATLLKDCGYQVPGFLDQLRKLPDGLPPVLGDDSLLETLLEQGVNNLAIAVAEPEIRKKLFKKVKKMGFSLPAIVHPKAYVAESVSVKEGCIIYPMAVIMNGCRLRESCLINSNVSLGHDTEIGAFSNINPGARLGGNIVVGEQCYIGIGATVIEKLTIGSNSVIAAGACAIKDIPKSVMCAGVPAQIKKDIL